MEPKLKESGPDSADNAIEAPVPARRVDRIVSGARRVASALLHGIPLELAFTVSADTKSRVLREFRERAAGKPIKGKDGQVAVMLDLLQTHFPDLQEGTTRWMSVRAFFFGQIGLWGKFG